MYKKGHIHFVGIGGIGMSGIAKILKYQGYTVSGCDMDLEQKSVEDLLSIGCLIYKGNNTPHCNDQSIDVLVYSSAINEVNDEIVSAQERGIPTIPRALMLAEIMRTKFSIAVSGAHGKTTTTSLISHILIESHQDPTVIIGGHLKNISSNARWGAGDFLVAEADESDRSFLRLYPTIAVVTNIDHEHLDTYKDLEDIKASFAHFISNVPFYGKAIVCIDDPHIRSLLPLPSIKTIKYGFDEHQADLFATDVILEKDISTCTVFQKNNPEPLGSLTITMPGKHNVLNALAAIAACMDVGVSFTACAQALQNFKGIERRFSFKGTFRGAHIFDDYGHHPTEIFNTLLVARKKAQRKLIVIFQPHRYSRTEKLWSDFVHLFAYSAIDHLIITDIYAASEKPLENVTSQNLVKAIQEKQPFSPVTYVPYDSDFSQIIQSLKGSVSEDDLVLIQGAGKVYKLAELLQDLSE
jgi:UDP-N-acetylmuramate--alanine ligase